MGNYKGKKYHRQTYKSDLSKIYHITCQNCSIYIFMAKITTYCLHSGIETEWWSEWPTWNPIVGWGVQDSARNMMVYGNVGVIILANLQLNIQLVRAGFH